MCADRIPVTGRRLDGRLILVVEDEPVIALDMQKALRDAGAMVVAAGMVESGLFATEHPELSGAVIDLRLGADKGTTVCRRLKQLGVPFVVYTGYPPLLVRAEFPDVPVISKPADPAQVVAELARLLGLGVDGPSPR